MSNSSAFKRGTSIYVFILALVALILVYFHFSFPSFQSANGWVLLFLLVSATILFNYYIIFLPPKGNGLSMDSSIYLATIFVYGIDLTLSILFISSVLFPLFKPKQFLGWQQFFNFSIFTVMIVGSYYTFIVLGGEVGPFNLANLHAYILTLVIYLFLNVFLIGVYFVIDPAAKALSIIKGILEESISNYFIMLTAALILTLLLKTHPIFGLIMFTFIIILISKALREYHLLYEEVSTDRTYREQIMNSLPVGIITFDNRTTKYTLNTSAERILNINPEKLKEFTSKKNSLNHEFRKIFSSNKKVHNVKVHYQTDQATYLLLVSRADLLDQYDLSIGQIFSFIDITEIEELEKRIHQSEKLALLGEISAKAAHEIRNPLTVIYGFLTLMKQNLSQSEQSKFHIPIMLNEFERINSIVDEMLTIAKPSAPVLAEAYIEDILEEVLTLYTPQEIEFKVDLERVPLLFDKRQMTQVIYNLIRNGSDAITGKGTISIYSKVQDGVYQLFIQDTGTGIPVELQKNIFDPFLTSKESGTGLGLTIVQRIIENHHGSIELYSSTEEGSTFLVTLPVAK
jgi:signal transduction histidine kinase